MPSYQIAKLDYIRASIIGLTASFAISGAAVAQKTYDTGASDTEIKIGNFVPYSGPASAYSIYGLTEAAYFKKVNDEGGINGRKVKFISYDDSYSPQKAVEQTRKLVESDEVLLLFGMVGTASNTGIQKYLNTKRIPQLFIQTGADKWNNPIQFPWTMSWTPSYQTEARIYAQYLMKEMPNGKIAVLYQNDDFGKDYLKGLRDGLGDKGSMIIVEEPYEVSEPTIDTHIVKLRSMNPDILIDISTPKFTAQAIKKVAELQWKPVHIISSVSVSVGAIVKPAGFENAQDVISAAYIKDAADPRWDNDPGMMKFYEFLKKYYPEANKFDSMTANAYAVAQILEKVLTQCGDNLTRENVMKQAANIKDYAPDTLLPGIRINTSPTDYAVIEERQLMRFKGEMWQLFGKAATAGGGG